MERSNWKVLFIAKIELDALNTCTISTDSCAIFRIQTKAPTSMYSFSSHFFFFTLWVYRYAFLLYTQFANCCRPNEIVSEFNQDSLSAVSYVKSFSFYCFKRSSSFIVHCTASTTVITAVAVAVNTATIDHSTLRCTIPYGNADRITRTFLFISKSAIVFVE